jgi:hypothetical protein
MGCLLLLVQKTVAILLGVFIQVQGSQTFHLYLSFPYFPLAISWV